MSTAEAQAELGRISATAPVPTVADPSNRRFPRRSSVSATAKASDHETDYKSVEVACKNALVSWPNAKAAILFGSRARGTHRADSDWDIAFITSTGESIPETVFRDLSELGTSKKIFIHGLSLSQIEYYENADSLGNVAASIAREGRLIAGRHKWPKTKKDLIMKPNEYEQWRSGAFEIIISGVGRLAKAIDNARRNDDFSALKFFVKESSDAAEYFAKIAFGKLASGTDTDIPRFHGIDQIVQKIDEIFENDSNGCVEKNAEWWQSKQGREFYDLLSRMNGHGRGDHLYGYEFSPPNDEVITRAVERLIATAEFAIREVDEFPGPADLRPIAIKVTNVHRSDLLKSASGLRRTLQDIDLNDSPFSAAGPVLSESVAVAASFGKEIVQAIEMLVTSLDAEADTEDRADAAP